MESAIQKPVLWSMPTDLSQTNIASKVAAINSLLPAIEQEFGVVAVASSLAVEDMVLTDLILSHEQLKHDCWQIFTLDTGRLHHETLALLEKIQERYQYRVTVFQPEIKTLQDYINVHGENAFYDSVERRKECCGIRKVEPLNRALQGQKVWLTGQRQEQSVTRDGLPLRELDQARGLVKFNPLYDWTERDIWAYVEQHQIPVNALYQKGYASIGCEPCTRAIRTSEDSRAGRWWWESQDTKECGLHAQNIQS